MLIGITHTPDGQPVVRVPRTTKVGIGIPKGRAAVVYIQDKKWVIRYGVWETVQGKQKLLMKTVATLNTRAEAEAWHNAHKNEAALSDRPQKLPFFTFTKKTVIDDPVSKKPVEMMEPDFAAIEAYGECPRDVDIVLMSDEPYSGEYQMWGATELKCHGNGVEAQRLVSMGNPSKEPGNFDEAKQANAKFWQVGHCFTNGCPFAEKECKPGVTLSFQLANSMRLGATAYFHTTSIRSASQLFSSLETIRIMAARLGTPLVGLPLKLVVAPFRTNHKGIAAMQYGVSLELRAEDMQALRSRLEAAAWVPRQIAPPAYIEEELGASGVAAEFYPEAEEPEFDDEPAAETPQATAAAEATQSKTDALREKLKAERQVDSPKVDPPKDPPPSDSKKGDLF